MMFKCAVCGCPVEYKEFYFDYDTLELDDYEHGSIVLCKRCAKKVFPEIHKRIRGINLIIELEKLSGLDVVDVDIIERMRSELRYRKWEKARLTRLK